MSFEKSFNAFGQSRLIDQSSPEGRREGPFCNSLLVYNNTKRAVSPIGRASPSIKNYKIWGPKEARAYHRINTGYKIAQYTGSKLRFLTLTTSRTAKDRDLKEDAHTLIKRIRRRYTARKFEYFRVRTNEGNGVLHIIYRGPYISRSWLKNQWESIHDSWNVDIRSCQRYHRAYIVNQYLCNQDASYTRYSMSGFWLMKGSLAIWKAFCHWYPTTRLELWDAYLKRLCDDEVQTTLDVGRERPPPVVVQPKMNVVRLNTDDALYRCIRCKELFKYGEGEWNESVPGYLCYKCYPNRKVIYGKIQTMDKTT